MSTEKCIAWTLRTGIVAGIAMIIIGEMMSDGNPILWLGVLILILSPLFGVIVALIGLLYEKDRFWAGIAAVLLTVVTIGLIIAVA